MEDRFFESLWGSKETDLGHILVWLYDGKATKESHWFKTATEATEFVRSIGDRKINVYMGVGLSPIAYRQDQRCLKKDVAGITGLWLDIDIQSPEHSKTNLPRNESEAMSLINGICKPSIVIHSGHGLQAWWLFNEIWMFDSAAERADAEHLEKRFIYSFKERAKKSGWDVDSVWNLDRVLRVPGTTNYKGTPVMVRTLQENDVRYNPSDFDWLPSVAADAFIAPSASGIVLDPAAEPPFTMFQAACENEPRFKASWDRARKDLQDQSASSYDMSLASFGAIFGWRDQEIVNLLIAFRRRHNFDLKLREDYYVRTLAAAKRGLEKVEAQEQLEVYASSQAVGATAPTDQNQVEVIKQNLSAVFGVQIIKILKFKADPPIYKLVTGTGEIALGEVAGLIGQANLRNSIAAATGRYLPRFKSEKWDNLAQALLDVCDLVEIGDDATEAGEMRAWLTRYLEDKPPRDDNLDDDMLRQLPVVVDGKVYVFGEDFRRWLRVTQQEKLTAKRMGYLMRAAGCEPERLAATIDGKATTRNGWRI